MNRLIPFLILLSLFVQPAAGQTAAPLRIGSIVIETLDVYSNREARHGFVYRAANDLHIETRASVIRQFLLFREGDVFVPERLAETERNLRALHYMKDATVTALEPRDGLVDVLVVTQDAWSIAPETQAGSSGGTTTYGAAITDTNLLGLGKELSVGWNKQVDRTRLSFDYQDPMMFSGYWSGHFRYGRNSDGHDVRYSVRRPFYSFATPWAAEFTDNSFRRDDKIYANGEVATQFQHEQREAVASYGWALAPSDFFADRLTAGLRLERHSFTHHAEFPASSLPPDRDYRYLFTRFEHVENDFLKLNFVNKDMRYEDFNLGPRFWVEGALSPRALGAAANSAFASAGASRGVNLAPTSFLTPSISVESRFDGGPQNTIASGMLYFVKRTGQEHPSTFVGRAVITGMWRFDRENQLFADGDTGLRGYELHSFAGSRSVMFNAEQRLYLGRELLQLLSPGVVVFADAGNATYGDFRELMSLKADLGVGLRIGLPRTPKNLLRIDLAWALQPDPFGRKGWLLSFSSGQAF